ncbi:MAG TPA: hypothetical protein VF814_11560 [Casimicrobiaceae bacterium]
MTAATQDLFIGADAQCFCKCDGSDLVNFERQRLRLAIGSNF